MDILNEKQQETLEQARGAIRNLKENLFFCTLPTQQQKEIDSALENLRISLESFSSEMFIVTSIGMLKAGKSTLVNLFSRNKDASPTGFGFDTTLRPALITQTDTDKGSIEIWTCSNAEVMSKEILGDVFACIRGVKKANEVKNASCCVHDLTPAILENALCKKPLEAENNILPSEPIMIVVKVPKEEGSLLSSKIMIMDTPGLDSCLSVWTDNEGIGSEQYSWLINNSDLLLFLQSSVAPLNQKAMAILKDIHAKQPNVPIYLVQNEIEAKHWLSKENLQKENISQREKAAEAFERVVSKAYNQYSVNLGKADTAIFDHNYKSSKEQFLQESGLQLMEEHIKTSLQKNMGPIRFKNCVNNAKREFDHLAELIQETQKNNDALKKAWEDKQKSFTDFENNMEKDLHVPPLLKLEYQKVNDDDIEFQTTNPFHERNKKNFTDLLERLKNKKFSADRYSAKDLSKIIQEIKDELLKRIKDKISNIRIDDFCLYVRTSDQKTNNIQNYLLEQFKKFVKEIFKHQNFSTTVSEEEMKEIVYDSLRDIKLPNLTDWLDVKPDNTQISISPKDNMFNAISNLWHGELSKRNKSEALEEFLTYYDSNGEGEFIDIIKDNAKDLKRQIKEWMNEITFDEMLKQFKLSFKEKIERKEKDFSKHIKETEKDKDTLNELFEVNEKCKKQIEIMENLQ